VNHNQHNIDLKYCLFYNMPIFISFEQVGGGGGLVDEKPIDASGKTADSISYSRNACYPLFQWALL
jgi:hypothetical protein